MKILTDYKNYEFTFAIMDYELLSNLMIYLNDSNDFFDLNFLREILIIIKNLFETEINYFGSLIDDKNFDENKLFFIKKFLDLDGMRILEKIIYMQKEDVINEVKNIMDLIERNEKLNKIN